MEKLIFILTRKMYLKVKFSKGTSKIFGWEEPAFIMNVSLEGELEETY